MRSKSSCAALRSSSGCTLPQTAITSLRRNGSSKQVEPPVRHPHVVVRRDDDVTAGGQEPGVAGVGQAPSRLVDAPHGREAVAHRAGEPRRRVVVDDDDVERVPALAGRRRGPGRRRGRRAGRGWRSRSSPSTAGGRRRRRGRTGGWRPADGRRRRRGRRPPGGDHTRPAPRRRSRRRSASRHARAHHGWRRAGTSSRPIARGPRVSTTSSSPGPTSTGGSGAVTSTATTAIAPGAASAGPSAARGRRRRRR